MSTTQIARSLELPLPAKRAVPLAQITGALLCAAIFAAAVWLRVWKLGDLPGINGDEAWSGVQALRFLAGESVAWRTPTGNPLNVFHFGPLVLLHAWLPPSFALLRSVAAVSGLLALVASYWLYRKSYDTLTAVTVTMLLACLPINVAYSRFAWDASQSLLATVLSLGASLVALRHRKLRTRATAWAAVAFGAGLWIHPTNVFIAPTIGVCLAYAWRAELRAVWSHLNSKGRQNNTLAAAFVLGMVAAWAMAPWLENALHRLVSPADWFAFARDFVRLFSGTSVYRFISGAYSGDALDVSDAIAVGLLAVAAVGFYARWKADRDACDGCLVVGWGLSVLGFFLVAGPAAIAPHFERYAIWLVAPTALLLARGAGWWMTQTPRIAVTARLSFAAVCVLLLVAFYGSYFSYLQQTGGTSHRAFHTAAIEPKAQAWQYIAEQTPADQPLRIVTDEWWSYWPLAYLAGGRANTQVVFASELPNAIERSTDETPAAIAEHTGKPPVTQEAKALWRVQFVSDRSTPGTAINPAENIVGGPEHWIYDYADRPTLRVFGPAIETSQNY